MSRNLTQIGTNVKSYAPDFFNYFAFYWTMIVREAKVPKVPPAAYLQNTTQKALDNDNGHGKMHHVRLLQEGFSVTNG